MTAAPPPPTAPLSRRAWWTIILGGTALVGVGVLLVIALLPNFLTSSSSDATPGEEPAVTGTGEERRIQATLFYVSPDGEALVPVSRSVPYGATPAEQARRIVEAQVAPPTDGAISAIPAETVVRHVFLAGAGEAYVDLGPEIVKGHTGGSLDEALAVFAIVNAITVNLPAITSVQILIDGKEVDTLVGHLDLRQPLVKAMKWVRRQ
jgi:hypothetical protein